MVKPMTGRTSRLPVRPWLLGLLVIVAFVATELTWMVTVGPQPRRARGRWLAAAGCPAPSHREDAGRADHDWALKNLDGKEISLGEFKDKVVFINVWATWCGPCVAEMPAIQKLADSLAKENVAFLLVSEEDSDTVRGFVEERRLAVPVYLSPNKLPEAFETDGIPATFIVDRGGTIVFKRVGAAEWDSDSCHTFLRSLL